MLTIPKTEPEPTRLRQQQKERMIQRQEPGFYTDI
jgi:hypothetical protein